MLGGPATAGSLMTGLVSGKAGFRELFARLRRFTGGDTTDPLLNGTAGTQIPAANRGLQKQAYIRAGTRATTVPQTMLGVGAFSRACSTVAAPPARWHAPCITPGRLRTSSLPNQ